MPRGEAFDAALAAGKFPTCTFLQTIYNTTKALGQSLETFDQVPLISPPHTHTHTHTRTHTHAAHTHVAAVVVAAVVVAVVVVAAVVVAAVVGGCSGGG